MHSIQDSYAHDGFWGNNNATHKLGELFQKNIADKLNNVFDKLGIKSLKTYPDDPSKNTDAFYAAYVASCKALNNFNKAVGLKDRYDIVDKETFLKGYKDYMDKVNKDLNDAQKKAEEGIKGKSNSENQESANQASTTSSSGSSPNTSNNNTDNSNENYGGYEPPSDPSGGQG